MHVKQGTVYYMAPEVLNENYDEKCDVWSAGVILYIMLCGYPPFNASNDDVIYEKIKKGEFQFKAKDWKNISQSAKDFITELLQMDPAKRPSAEQAFKHPWVQEYACIQKAQTIDKIEDALFNMKKYHYDSKVQQACYLMMVDYVSTQEEKDSLLLTFQQLDTNGDGVLSRDELVHGFKNVMHIENSDKLVNDILKIIDNNGNGFIDYTEFVMAATDAKLLVTKKNLQKIFNMIDTNQNGQISKQEFQQFFGSAQVGNDDWKKLLLDLKHKSDDYIDFSEFQQMMDRMINPNVYLK